jgi:hypothetical protein
VTKPGNSDPEEPTADKAPEPPTADVEPTDSTAGTPADDPTEASREPSAPAEDQASPPPTPHESPTRSSGGPPSSTLSKATDNSGPAEVTPVDNASADAAEPAGAAKPAGGAEPTAKAARAEFEAADPTGEPTVEADSAGAGAAEGTPAEAGPGAEAAESRAAGAKPVTAKPTGAKPAAKPRRAEVEDAEPLMAELEKAPPPPREQARRAQAKRRFEEPPPRTLRFSFYFFVAAGLVWLVSMVLSLIYKQQIIDSQIKNNQDPKITPDQIAGAVNQILWVVTIAALAFTIFLGLFGYKATEGTRRARTLVTIFAAMLVIFHLLLNGTQLGILSAMFALVGLALLWSPSARAYFPPRQQP